jgi:hypothetical protein
VGGSVGEGFSIDKKEIYFSLLNGLFDTSPATTLFFLAFFP